MNNTSMFTPEFEKILEKARKQPFTSMAQKRREEALRKDVKKISMGTCRICGDSREECSC